jgi:hypothetical protein
MTVDGVLKSAGVMQSGGNTNTSSINGSAVKLHHGGYRLYLTETCSEAFAPDSFVYLSLLGKTLSYSVDLSHVSCGCNAAIYLVSMPGYVNATGPPDSGTRGDYYCDANTGGAGQASCPEVDLMEANIRVSASTLHQCKAPYWDDPQVRRHHVIRCIHHVIRCIHHAIRCIHHDLLLPLSDHVSHYSLSSFISSATAGAILSTPATLLLA